MFRMSPLTLTVHPHHLQVDLAITFIFTITNVIFSYVDLI